MSDDIKYRLNVNSDTRVYSVTCCYLHFYYTPFLIINPQNNKIYIKKSQYAQKIYILHFKIVTFNHISYVNILSFEIL